MARSDGRAGKTKINGKWRAVDADYEYANIVGIGSARNSIERIAI
jgi:hypothetical protein